MLCLNAMKIESERQKAVWKRLFGLRLRFLRTLGNLTQGDLARRLGITVEHLSNMERGTSAPSFAMVVRLAEALDTEPANLFLFTRSGKGEGCGGSPDFEWTSYIAAVGSYDYVAGTGESFWSDSLYRLLGLEPGEEVAGQETFLRHIHPDDRERMQVAMAGLVAGQDAPVQSFRLLRKDGRERFVLTQRIAERDESGRLVRLHGVVLDVTEQRLLIDSLRTLHANLEERVRERTEGLAETVARLEEEVGRRTRAEAQARENESRLRSLGENLAGGAVFRLARDGDVGVRLVFASAGLAALVGAGPGEGLPDMEQVLAAMHPEDREAFVADLEQCGAEARPLRREVRFPRPDGTVAWVRFQASCRGGRAPGQYCDGLALDITDLKRAEAERLLAVERLQRAHALARLGHWEYRPAQKRSWWSDEIYESFGYAPQSRPITLEVFLSHIHPDDRDRVARELSSAVAELREYHCSFRVVRKDGGMGFGYSLGRPVEGKQPGEVVYHGTYLDVTEHKAACATIREESERLHALMAAAGLGTWVWEGDTVTFDPVCCRILGLDPEAGTVPVDEARSWLAPEDWARRPPLQGPGPVRAEFRTVVRFRPPGGVERRVLLVGCMFRNPKGLSTRAEGLLLALDDLSAP